MEQELKLFRNMVQALLISPDKYQNDRARTIVKKMRELQLNPIVGPEALGQALPTVDNVYGTFPNKDFLYLNPVTNNIIMVPILWIECDFSRLTPKIRILLGLFTLDNDVDEEKRFKGLGYRFETPEGQSSNGSGIHNYYHVQIIRSLRGTYFPPQKYSEWLPESQPAFPLDCQSPIQLLLALLVALYGRDAAFEPFLHQRSLMKAIKPYRDEMWFGKFLEMKWHWMIQNRDTMKIHQYCQSTREAQEYPDIVNAYPGCSPVKILPSTYNASAEGQKRRLSQ